MKGFKDMIIEKDDGVFYQTHNEKAWLGTAKVVDVDKNWVWIAGSGDLKRVPKYNVKLSTKKKIGTGNLRTINISKQVCNF